MKKTLPLNDADFKRRMDEVFRELYRESDRGIVLVGASLLEENLELVLRSVMLKDVDVVKKVVDPLFQGFGAFATFSAKSKACYALNMIDEETFHDIEIIRDIRNTFAHSYRTASFSDETIMARVGRLTTAKLLDVQMHIPPGTEIEVKLVEGLPSIKMNPTKMGFLLTIAFLGSFLQGHMQGFADATSNMEGDVK